MIKDGIKSKLQEIFELKFEIKELESERDEYLKTDWDYKGLTKRHRKLNKLQRRVTYLFNLKSVLKAIWGEETRAEASRLMRGKQSS